jgi:hypothetical protein
MLASVATAVALVALALVLILVGPTVVTRAFIAAIEWLERWLYDD